MSHFTKVNTELRNLATVEQALKDLGYTVETGIVRGFAGQTVDADLVVRSEKDSYDIGFSQEGSKIVMQADLWGLQIDHKQFMSQLMQRYAYLTVVEQTTAEGWQKLTEEVQEDGSIRLVVQRWS